MAQPRGTPVLKERRRIGVDREWESGETKEKIIVTRNNVKLELPEKKQKQKTLVSLE